MSSEHADCLNSGVLCIQIQWISGSSVPLSSQPRIGESVFTMPADPKRKKFGWRLFNWITWIPHAEDPDFVKTFITLLNKYNDVIFFNNSFKSGRERIQSWMKK